MCDKLQLRQLIW